MRNKDTDLYKVVNNMKSLKLDIQDEKAIERNYIQGKAKTSESGYDDIYMRNMGNNEVVT